MFKFKKRNILEKKQMKNLKILLGYLKYQGLLSKKLGNTELSKMYKILKQYK